MTERKLRIGVAGATGAVGREILGLLADSQLPVGELVPMASPACTSHTVEWRGDNLRVENQHQELLSTCDLVFVATPAAAAGEALTAIMDEGIPCIDLSGTLAAAPGVPVVVPAANRMDLQQFREQQAVASPRPDVVCLTTLLAPLRVHSGDLRCRGTVMHSAASHGRAGIEELSNQVVSLFNSRTPQRKVFEQGLAFDLVPALGRVGELGWTDHELRCSARSAAILGLPPDRIACTSVLGPWFNGICLDLRIEADVALDAALVARVLAEAPGVSVAAGAAGRELPRPRAADGLLSIQVGRLRDDPGGGAVHLWAVADELRLGAAGNAVSLLAALLEDDLI
jgi:aspartate-semialdehyde dehydrogenase